MRKGGNMENRREEAARTAMGLYDPQFEHDNCGIGAVVNIKGLKTHETVENALKIVENLKHRAQRRRRKDRRWSWYPLTDITQILLQDNVFPRRLFR